MVALLKEETSDELPPATCLPEGAACSQCAGPLVAETARGCRPCGYYLCPKCVVSPATNGYENQEVIIARAKGKSVAELLLEDPRTAAEVGPATIFVSWYLAQKLGRDLFDALEEYMNREGLDRAHTYFWVCDYIIRQGYYVGVPNGDETKPELFADVICDIGRTLVLCTPWDDPGPLKRSWCLWEIKTGAEGKLEVILSREERARFRRFLAFRTERRLERRGARSARRRFSLADILSRGDDVKSPTTESVFAD